MYLGVNEKQKGLTWRWQPVDGSVLFRPKKYSEVISVKIPNQNQTQTKSAKGFRDWLNDKKPDEMQ